MTLARYLEANELPGRIRYYGCPAEEAGAGKTFMAFGQYVAQGKLPAAHKALTHAATVISATGLDLITRPELLAAARAEHAANTAATPYGCPIPKDLLAPLVVRAAAH